MSEQSENFIQHDAPENVIQAIRAALSPLSESINGYNVWPAIPNVCALCNNSQAKTSYFLGSVLARDKAEVTDDNGGFFCEVLAGISLKRRGLGVTFWFDIA